MISVIIPALNEEKFIGRCLKAVEKQNFDGRYETIVVDGGSEDRTRDIAEKYSDKVIIDRRKGVWIARNRGIEESEGEILAFLDADCVPTRNWLSTIRTSLENFDGVSGPCYPIEEGEGSRAFFIFWSNITNKISSIFGFEGGIGGNLALKKSTIETIGGGFRNIFPEDFELIARINKYGNMKFNSEMKVLSSMRRFQNWKDTAVYLYEIIKNSQLINLGIKNKDLEESEYWKDVFKEHG